jgi:atypical dual specificity phosphatase
MHASRIIENKLYIGSCPITEGDIIELKAAGITAVISLQTDDDLAQRDIDWPAMEDAYKRHGMEVRRMPIEDFSPSDMRKKLRGCVREVDGLIRAGHVVYLHCNAGINRSPTVAVAYLHWAEKWDLRAAYKHVIECRPCDPYVHEIMLAPAE